MHFDIEPSNMGRLSNLGKFGVYICNCQSLNDWNYYIDKHTQRLWGTHSEPDVFVHANVQYTQLLSSRCPLTTLH